jgi:hypothetical protein
MSLQRRQLILAAPALWYCGRAVAGAAQDVVVYPRHDVRHDTQNSYLVRLMHLALERSGHSYRTQATPQTMVQSRALLELAKPDPSIDVFWTMSDRERERTLLPVRIPLERGLIGWRLALVRRADMQRMSNVRALGDLSRHRAGQMHDWPDTAILRANGLTVQTSSHYPSLFSMLAKGRIDYFPRSVIEIGAEREEYRHLDLEIDPHLLLHYPAALYFFVSPQRPRLADDLRRGLERMQSDGSFEQLFRKQFGDVLGRYRLNERRVLHLDNPGLSADTPLQRKELWWAPPP